MKVKGDANDNGIGQPPEARGGFLKELGDTFDEMRKAQFKNVGKGLERQLDEVVGNKEQADPNLQKNALLDFSNDPDTKNPDSMKAFKQTDQQKADEDLRLQGAVASMAKLGGDGDVASKADQRFDQMVNKNPHEVEPVRQAA